MRGLCPILALSSEVSLRLTYTLQEGTGVPPLPHAIWPQYIYSHSQFGDTAATPTTLTFPYLHSFAYAIPSNYNGFPKFPLHTTPLHTDLTHHLNTSSIFFKLFL